MKYFLILVFTSGVYVAEIPTTKQQCWAAANSATETPTPKPWKKVFAGRGFAAATCLPCHIVKDLHPEAPAVQNVSCARE